MRAICLTILVVTASGGYNAGDVVTHVVPYWTDDAGYCNPLPGLAPEVHRQHGLDRIYMKKGDRLSITFSTHHDVWSHPTLESLEACDHTGDAYMLADVSDGGGCEDEADLECMAAATPFVHTPSSDGPLYLSCSVSDHCENGQRLVVEVDSGRRAPPSEVVVPLWTDDAGYCKPIPGVFPPEQHHGTHGLRPHGADREGGGLEPITIAVGQALVFKYSTHHDVWQHPSAESLTACDYTGAVMLADTTQGGGCEEDADLVCIGNSVGWKLVPTAEQVGTKLYLSCSIGDHCSNGQTIVVTVVEGTPAEAEDAAAPAAVNVEVSSYGGVGPLLGGMLLGAGAASIVWYFLQQRSARGKVGEVTTTGLAPTPARPGASEDPGHV